MTYEYIDNANQLSELCSKLKSSQWLAVDTEFIREKTYFARLCLVQIASPDSLACIDTIAISDLTPLYELLGNRSITKVLHASKQDLEIFFNHTQTVPAPVFDTQLGANLIGLGDQLSYGATIESLLGISLDKSHARSDWSKRPLADKHLKYAVDDVRYLAQVYPLILEKMRSLGRSDWLDAEHAELCEPATYRIDPSTIWQRIRSAKRLKGVQLAIIRQLGIWRENRAEKTDKPRKWILSDEVLLELATRAPATLEQLQGIKGMPASTARKSGESILHAIECGKSEEQDNWPKAHPHEKLTPEQSAKVEQFQALVQRCSEQLGVSPSMVATRKELTQLARGDRSVRPIFGWRKTAVGDKLLELLETPERT